MISVIVPTYNERDNIRDLLERLDAVLSATDLDFEVLVIDDDSPDGTADAAREAGAELGLDVRVVVRTRNPDLSRSVVRGFREARGEVFVVMDADFQHPPELVPELARSVSPEVPIAIGTRYNREGEIEDWPLFRRLVSFGALFLAKLFVPPTRGITDPISGFFAVRADAIRMDDLSPDGYKILVELLRSIDPVRVAEIGFVFESREHGDTSLDFEQYTRFLRHIVVSGIEYRIDRLASR